MPIAAIGIISNRATYNGTALSLRRQSRKVKSMVGSSESAGQRFACLTPPFRGAMFQ